ncbi:hypothetical protein SAMN04488506_1219 [Desemzia incerta]|uniref:Uncharacterized protein n=1 Tax=Desemzia incerta TaxID=82801 RepID=A0A1I5X6C9_9LACT|nr:hypothetical protein [Desemzia incerta]SFQ27510.1 hypothetical protein SAMN04488506_1219 [Desemzia incerta]
MAYNPKAKVFVFTLPSNESSAVTDYNAVIRHVAALYANVHLIDLYGLYCDDYRTGLLAGSNNGHLIALAYNYESVMIEKAINNYLYEYYKEFMAVPYA